MFARFSLVFIFICLSFAGLSQTLSISSTGQTGTSGTNWTISGTTLTVSGTANIAGSVIESKLSSGSLSIVGSTSSLSVYINQTISSTTSGSGLTIGATNNAGTVILNNSLSIAGSLSIIAGRVSVLGTMNLSGSSSNLSVTSTNTVVNATSTIGGSASISATSNFILGTNITAGTAYPFTANGGFTKTGSGTSYLFSDIITSNTAVNFTGPVVIGNFNTSNTTTEIKTNGGALNIPGALSAYSGNGLAYTVLLYSYLYDADCATITGSSTDLYFRFNTGTHTFSGLPGISTPFSTQYLVVAGGGGGGSGLQFQYAGGGGGGGGVANGNYTFSGTPITIAVGQGGSQNTNGADSYLDNIKSGGGGAGGNHNYTIGLVGNGGAGYAAGGGGGGSGSNTGGGYAAGGTGTQRNGGNGAACCGDINWGGSGGGSVGNAPTSPYVDGAGYSSNITGSTVVYGIGAKCQATAVAKTGGGGGSAAYGTVTGADGTVILRVTLSNASTLSAMSPSTALHLNAAAGAVTLSSTVSNLASLLVTADASSSITGPVTGTGSLTKAGIGILTLAGNHTYSGGTTVNAGTLKLDDTAPDDGNGVIVGTLNVNQNATVQLAGLTSSLGWNTNRVTTLNINGGVVEAISGKQHIWNVTGGLNFNGGGTFRSNNGVSNAAATSYIEWGAGNITITNPTAPAIIAGRINLRGDFTGGAITFAVNDGATEHDLLISAAITQTSAPTVTKTGAGKMTFTGENSYSGTTTISTGIFQVGDGSTTGSISSGSVVNNAAIIFKRSNDYTISNAISGTGTIEKLGAGILTFSGGNSYTGVSTVTQGVLKIGTTNALGTIAGNTIVSDGAAIDLNGITLGAAEPLTIYGTGLSTSGALYNSSTTAVTLPSPITLGAAALIKGGSANLTISGAINGAFNLEVQGTNNSFTQSGIIGASSAPTSYIINTGTGSVTLGAAATIAGPVNMYGNTITFSSALTTSGDLSLNANTAVTQTAAIIAAGISLNGTGTFTLTNASNNFATLAGGSTGSLLGATQIIDVSGGLTIGTVGSISGLTGSSTIRVETLAGNITLAGSISTTSTSTDAVILTSAKSTAIGVPSGGDIIVSGSPTITMGSGAIAKLFSGYDVTSTGLTTLVGGASNARYNYDETSTTYNPTLSANNKYAIYRTGLSYGDLTIVSSAGDTEGTTWTYTNGVIKTISGTANVLNTDIQTKLNSANLSIEANKVTFSANVTGTTSNSLSILSKTHIVNTNATTITTAGGNVLFASNVDDATDGESTTNGYTQLRYGITINTNGGNITFGGGNTSGSDYSLGSFLESYTEGIRFDGVIALNSSGGNIALRGKSYAMGLGAGFGASGVGFYYFSAATGTINSGAGTVTIDGYSQTNGSTYSSGFYCMNNLTISSANTTANAISISGKATGVNGDAVGIETEGTFSVLATADGGGITIRTSQQIADFYDVLFRAETNILAKSGPIQLLGKQDGGVANGRWYIYNNSFLGSKALSAVPTSSSNITIQYDLYSFSGYNPKLASSGTIDWRPASAIFGQNVQTDWFSWNQNSQTISGLTIGKSGNTANVYLNSVLTVAGPISVYGGYVEVSGAITNSATGNILFKGITNSGSCINIYAGITKSSGTGTLTLQGHGRVNISSAIAATGSASLNVILWSDFDSDNAGGGSTLSSGSSISTNGGHVWLGGSNSVGGSYNWNDLAVGDGPSVGASGANCNAIDLFGPITTGGGDVLLWASVPGCGTSGIVSDVNRLINAGSGDITFIAPQTSGSIELTSTGVISLVPHAGSYAGALTIGGTLTTGNFSFNTSYYNGLKINSLSNSGLVIGNYSGHLSGTTAVTQGNSSNVTVSSALTTKSLEIYGGAIALNEHITTTGTSADVLIKALSNINLAAAKTITTAAGDVNLWSDSDDNATGYVQLLAGAAINSTGGDINLGGGANLTSDYAFGTTAETCPEATGTQYISGVHFRQGSSLTSTGGNISVRGQNANTANSAMSFGISLRGVSMNSGTGKISLNGVATGTSGVNAQGVASWGTLTLRSANTSSDAISITGNALASTGSSSLGVNTVALFEATGVGGGIIITGKSGVASTNASVNIGGDILAVSGPITISGENFSGVQDNIAIGSTTVIGKKALTNVTTSSSNVILEGNKITTTGSVFVDCSGTLTVQPFGASFASALSWPMTNVTHASNLGGLTLGKLNNAANITIGAATSINGPITLYGGTLALNNALTTTNTSTGNLSLNGTTLSGSSTLTVANGRTLTMNLSSNTDYAGLISGTSLNFVKDGAGTLTLPTPTALSFAAMTISAGAYTLNANQQLTLTGALTNNGAFTMKDGATFVQATSGASIDGTGTYTVEKALASNSSTWSTTSGRFWYMGVPMVNVARSSYGTQGTTTNRVWSYSEATKQYTELSNANDVLSAGTGYVHRRSTDGTLTFSATGANGLYGSDYSVSGLTKTAGYTSGVNLVSNPYMGYLDWNAVYNQSTNIDPTFYIRSNNTSSNNISALISYNGSTQQYTNTSSVSNTSNFRYIAPMQSVWVKVGTSASTGTVNMNRSMLSHQTGNTLKSSTVFPTLARVNLVDGDLFDQLLVYMNSDMTNEVDQYDSEKLPVSGTVQLYTMASNKKLVMNGLKNNKKKVSVPLYLELPETKSYTIQLADYVLEDGLILLEDKQEGTMQDFTLMENYTFYANSGQLYNRFVLHFILPNAELTTQGPSNSWVGPETSYTDGGNVQITNDDRGNIEITVDQPEEQKVEGNVTVTDMNGKEIYKGQLDGITTAVALNVPAGIYYLTVQSGTLFEKKKVFIQE